MQRCSARWAPRPSRFYWRIASHTRRAKPQELPLPCELLWQTSAINCMLPSNHFSSWRCFTRPLGRLHRPRHLRIMRCLLPSYHFSSWRCFNRPLGRLHSHSSRHLRFMQRCSARWAPRPSRFYWRIASHTRRAKPQELPLPCELLWQTSAINCMLLSNHFFSWRCFTCPTGRLHRPRHLRQQAPQVPLDLEGRSKRCSRRSLATRAPIPRPFHRSFAVGAKRDFSNLNP